MIYESLIMTFSMSPTNWLYAGPLRSTPLESRIYFVPNTIGFTSFAIIFCVFSIFSLSFLFFILLRNFLRSGFSLSFILITSDLENYLC